MSKRVSNLRVLLVDDHTIFREGLAKILKEYRMGCDVEQTSSALDAVRLLDAPDAKYDLLITDIQMPRMNGIELIRHAVKARPSLPIVALTVDSDVATTFETLMAGAKGYLVKTCESSTFLLAVEKVLSGNKHIDATLAADLFDYASREDKTETLTLSPREMDILRYLVEGLTSHEIGMKLSIAKKTVDNHRTNILSKTGAKNIGALAILAKAKRWI